MPNSGDILYAIDSLGLMPVTVTHAQEVEQKLPSGETYSETMVSVQNRSGQVQHNYAGNFTFVPYIPDMEISLAGQEKAALPGHH
jgi:hypothetical protein